MSGNEFRLPYAKGNAIVFPFASPQARACNKRITLFARVLYHCIVARPHQWKIATHMPAYTLHHTEMERLILFVAKDHTTQLGNVFCILWSRPTLNKPLTQLATIVSSGGC